MINDPTVSINLLRIHSKSISYIFYNITRSFLFGAKIRPCEVVIACSPSLPILFHSLFIFGKCSLSEFELFFPLIDWWYVFLGCGLKSLIGRESLLEVHPVLCSVIKWFLNEYSVSRIVFSDKEFKGIDFMRGFEVYWLVLIIDFKKLNIVLTAL